MGLINALDTPEVVTGSFGESITLTHEAYGITLQVSDNEYPLIIWTTHGVFVDGVYRAYPGSEKYARCTSEDLTQLFAANPEINKPAGRCNTDDIKSLYLSKIAVPAPA